MRFSLSVCLSLGSERSSVVRDLGELLELGVHEQQHARHPPAQGLGLGLGLGLGFRVGVRVGFRVGVGV